jgi:putative tryptophan/tyrosine transport system substrate-binding protein
MKRRDFIKFISAAIIWPFAARAQQTDRIRRIGILTGQAADDPQWVARFEALKKGLLDLGWEEGRNISFDYRHAVGTPEQLHTMAAEMVSSNVDIILAGATGHVILIHKLTSTIPVVSLSAAALQEAGVIDNLRRPGGNVTGFDVIGHELMSKRLGLLQQLLPNVQRIGFIEADAVSISPAGRRIFEITVETARALKIDVHRINVNGSGDFGPAFATMTRQGDQAVFVPANPVTTPYRDEIIGAAAQNQLPTFYDLRMFVVSGGLISYGFDLVQLAREAATYVDKILKGAKPGDLPVQQPTKFELVINLKTAKSLGLDVPTTLLALADEVIE